MCPWLKRLRRDRTIYSRELGKLAPKLREKGCQPQIRLWLIAITRWIRLFTKNVADRGAETPSTIGDFCPVQVSQIPVQGNEGPVNGGGNYDPLKVA